MTMTKSIMMAALAVAFCASCQDVQQKEKERKAVTFDVGGIVAEYDTRAALQDEQITDLYIWEGTTLLKHQVITDEDFGAPTIEFDYGTHNITFVASKATGQSWASGKWSCTKVADTFGKALELQVAKGSSTSQQVELSRIVAKVQWTIEDKVPAAAVSMDVSVSSHLSLTSALAGADASTYEVTGVNTSSWAGSTGKQPSVIVLPAAFGSESDCTAAITFKRTDGTVICSYTKDVTVLSNRCTNIHGSFFAINPTMAVTVNNAWSEQKDVDL